MQDVLRSLMPLHLILYSKIFKDYIMKRIIMFKGGVETLEFFSVEIAEYLESKGYEIFWYNLLLSKNSFNELMHYYNNHCNEQLYAITFNFEGLEGEEGLYNNDGWNFWDYSGVTVIFFLNLLISLLTTLYITISFLKLCLNIIVRSILTICILII